MPWDKTPVPMLRCKGISVSRRATKLHALLLSCSVQEPPKDLHKDLLQAVHSKMHIRKAYHLFKCALLMVSCTAIAKRVIVTD